MMERKYSVAGVDGEATVEGCPQLRWRALRSEGPGDEPPLGFEMTLRAPGSQVLVDWCREWLRDGEARSLTIREERIGVAKGNWLITHFSAGGSRREYDVTIDIISTGRMTVANGATIG